MRSSRSSHATNSCSHFWMNLDRRALEAGVAAGAGRVDRLLCRFPGLRLLRARRISLHRHGQPRRPRRRPQSVRMVRSHALPLGRHAAAVAGPISSGRVLLHATRDRRLRLLPVFLFRELALHGNLHGRRACHGPCLWLRPAIPSLPSTTSTPSSPVLGFSTTTLRSPRGANSGLVRNDRRSIVVRAPKDRSQGIMSAARVGRRVGQVPTVPL